MQAESLLGDEGNRTPRDAVSVTLGLALPYRPRGGVGGRVISVIMSTP
jgi:hypothetical protein